MEHNIGKRHLAVALLTVLMAGCGDGTYPSPEGPATGSPAPGGGVDGGSGDAGGGNGNSGGGTGAGSGSGDGDGSGTGGGGNDGDGTPGGGGQSAFPEPTGARYDDMELDGFYDIDASGKARVIRDDLGGTLPGMVQFVQSHSVDPAGNEARNMPRLTSERAALLLVTPQSSDVESLQVTVSLDGAVKQTLTLMHPNAMYRSDFVSNSGRPDYVYSRRAWSVELPWDLVKPGMSLVVSDDRGRSGTLAASRIEFGAPAELVVQSIRLGMLTNPPDNDNEHWMLTRPESAAADYFQTIPAARLTVGHYETMRLDRVMVANGTIYDTQSAGTGDVYSGDMRENVGKSTVSVGINLANFGATASGMAGQGQPQLFQHVLTHHAAGQYTNGRVSHGLSGGNGMLTLYTSRGNEFSHEIGHHYGLGHFPGESNGNYFLSGHHHDSGWGYIAYRKRMRGNIHWTRAANGGMAGMPDYRGVYSFGTDAMAGGHYASALSNYTHYTGYSTRLRIQPSLNRVVPSASSSTGYVQWNPTTLEMEDVRPRLPGNLGQHFFNSPDGYYFKPRLVGVPVFTVLGGYNPDNGNALLYPAFRGSWGNVFNLPAPESGASTRQCWLQVTFAGGATSRIAVAGRVLQANSVNKLHINIAQADRPQTGSLNCQEPGAQATVLASMTFPQNLPPMKPPVVVGKEAGYSALRAVELPELDAILRARDKAELIDLGTQGNLLFASWGQDPSGLSQEARAVLTRYRQQEQRAQRLNRWINRYRSELQATGNAAAVTAFRALVETLGLDAQPLLPPGQPMLVGQGHCVRIENKAGVYSTYVAQAPTCKGGEDELWFTDIRGSIHSVAHPAMCLTSPGGNNRAVTVARCDRSDGNQAFDLKTLPAIGRGGSCLDLSGNRFVDGRGALITYACSGGTNQRWTGITQSGNTLVALLSPRNLELVMELGL